MFSTPNRHAHCTVLPTKTSLRYNQFAGVSHSFLSAGTHVSSTSFVSLFVLMIFVAVTLLKVSLLLIACCCLALNSSLQRGFPEHLFHTLGPMVGPWYVIFCCCHWLSLLGFSSCRVMLLHPGSMFTFYSCTFGSVDDRYYAH